MATKKPEQIARQKALHLQRRGATIPLQGKNHFKKVSGLIDPATGQPSMKQVLDAVSTAFSIERLSQLKGRLFYIEDVHIPVVEMTRCVTLDVIEIMAAQPTLMAAVPADSKQYRDMEAYDDFIHLITQDIPEAPMKGGA